MKKRVLSLLLVLVMVLGMLPGSAFATDEPATKTVTLWAVQRTTADSGVTHTPVIEPTVVTLYEGTTLRCLLDDLTGKTSVYTTSGTYLGRLLQFDSADAKNIYWRGFTKDKNGTVTGYMNVRDQLPQDGDTIILTTALSDVKEPYETLPEDLSWPGNVSQTADLTSGAEGALDMLSAKQFLKGNTAIDNVTGDLEFPAKTAYSGTDYRVTWSSSAPGVISNAGAVTRPRDGRDAQVTLTATVRDGPSKTFDVTVRAYSADEAAVLNVKDLLDWNYIANGNAAKTKILQNLYLPTSIEGYEGVSIAWVSTKAAIAPDGTVTRNGSETTAGSNVTGINLTATVTKGDASAAVSINGLAVLGVTSNEVNLNKDVKWLKETWAADLSLDSLITDLDLPTKGGAGNTTIKWATSDDTVITAAGNVTRPAAGEAAKTATLTASLTSGSYSRTAEFPVTVSPWTAEGQAEKDAKLRALTELLTGLGIPEQVDASNQAAVTASLKPNRGKIADAYDAARAAGASAAEIENLPQYQLYTNAEASLRKLPKTLTVSIIDVTKVSDGNYSYSGGYFLEKSKVVISGTSSGDAANDVATAVSKLKQTGLFSDSYTGQLIITINGEKIKADGDYAWHYAIDGVDRGIFSGLSSAKTQVVDHGDCLVLYFAKADDTQFLQDDYAAALPDDAPVDYDFANAEIFDANWLTEAMILGENPSRYAVTEDLTLPTLGKSGSKIAWASNNSAVISNNGKVTRPDASSSNATVQLTATIGTSTASKQTRTFTLTVKAQAENLDAKTLAYAAEQLTLDGLDAVTGDLTLPLSGFGGTVISWSSSNSSVIAGNGKVTRQAVDTTVQLTAALTCGVETTTKVFTANVLRTAESDGDIVTYDKAALTFDVIRGENTAESDIRSPLHLPAAGVMGSQIQWASDKPEAVSVLGQIARTDTAQSVTLTATLVYGTAQDTVTFHLTLPAMTDAETALQEAEAALAALPDALRVSVDDRQTAQAQADIARTLVEAAVSAGYTEANIPGIERLTELETKLENLPVEITFSILGAKVENQLITAYDWFYPKSKLLVPVGTNLADITQAIIKGYDSVRPGSGQSYYGTILGLSQFDAGKGSGWIYGGAGEGIDTSQGAMVSVPGQGSVVYWAFTGEWSPNATRPDQRELGLSVPLDSSHPVDKNLVPATDITALESLIEQAAQLTEADYRDYGSWKGSWDAMQTALVRARSVVSAQSTALAYEVDDAVQALSGALDTLQPNNLDKTLLQGLADQAKALDEADYYPAGWDDLMPILAAAEDVLDDPYAETAAVSQMEAELQTALQRLIPKTQADKTALQAALDSSNQLIRESYTLASWQRLEQKRGEAAAVMNNTTATEAEVVSATNALQTAISSLLATGNQNITSGNKVVYQAISDYQNTAEAWKILDMVLLGHGDEVSVNGYLVEVSQLLQSGKASGTDLERTAIVLTALGYDVTNITMPDGSKLNLIAQIEQLDLDGAGVNTVIFALLAVDAGNYDVLEYRALLQTKLLSLQNADGGWPIYAEGTSDLDMTAMAISALAPYAAETDVEDALAKAFVLLESSRNKLASTPDVYGGNCNTTAMAMIAYFAAPRFSDGTTINYLKNGGLSYYITETDQLGYQNDTAYNDLATEQGVRAYAAYDRYTDSDNAAQHIYRFDTPTKALKLPDADLPVIQTDLKNQAVSTGSISFHATAQTADGAPAAVAVTVNGTAIAGENGAYSAALSVGANTITIQAAGSNGAVTTQSYTVIRQSGGSQTTITVTFSLTGDSIHGDGPHIAFEPWIPECSVAVPAGSSVRYLTELLLLERNIPFVTSGTYISEINGLGEFDNGRNSGWMYRCNDRIVDVSYADCYLKDGDTVAWFYSDDYLSETGYSGSWDNVNSDTKAANEVIALINAIGTVTKDSGSKITAARKAYDALTDKQKALVSNYDVLTAAEAEYAKLTTGISFTDVSETDWYYEAVKWAVEQGITNGTSETTFSPSASCTRAQMVTFLWRAAGSPKTTAATCVFTDVDKDAYYYEALLWAVEIGITNGTSAATFSPDASCTRGQMATFLYRNAKSPAVSGSHAFTDVEADACYNDAVIWAAAERITVGTSATTFSPDADCTRGQMVTFICRYLAE